MEELFDVYDINGDYIGVKPKSFCHSKNPGVFHKPVWIWIVNANGQVLLQKRAATKKFIINKSFKQQRMRLENPFYFGVFLCIFKHKFSAP